MKSQKIINKEANKVLKKYKCEEAPIHVENIAHKMGATVMFSDLEDDLSGFLVVKDGVKTIVVNEKHHPKRQRFTIAHEIGHLILHVKDSKESLFLEKKRVYNRNLVSSAGIEPVEVEANRFAAALLMPEKMILETVKKENKIFDEYGDSDNSISIISRKFNVSQTAVTHRISSLFSLD